MKISKDITEALLTVDDEALGAAFKGAFATYIENEKADEYYERCARTRDESLLCMVILLETIFKEDEGKK